MTPKEFVAEFAKEKDAMVREWLLNSESTETGNLIQSMGLTDSQKVLLGQVLNSAATDCFYTVLLGLDGAASIGDLQTDYQLLDEDGISLTGEGLIEAEAWSAFHGSSEE